MIEKIKGVLTYLYLEWKCDVAEIIFVRSVFLKI